MIHPDGQFVRDLTLSDFPFLTSLAASENQMDRRIWLRIATDHFVAADPNDPGMIERFTKAILPQLDAADRTTRLEIAQKLAPCPRTPLEVLARFEELDSEACAFVLQYAIVYTDRDLTRAVARGVPQATAVAKRADLAPHLVDMLAAHQDIDVAVALACNKFISLEGPTLRRLLTLARHRVEQSRDRRLADALLRRRPVLPENAALFLAAEPNQRVEILLAAQRTRLGRPLDFCVGKGLSALGALEQAAASRQPERFVAVLAEALDCEPDLAQRIADDASGEPLAVALAALGASYEVLVRVLISNDLAAGFSYERIRALARLNNALNRNSASIVVAALRDDDFADRRRQLWSDARARPGSLQAPLVRPVGRAADPRNRKLAN